MRPRFIKAIFTILFILAVSSVASALPPRDALSARGAESVYVVAGIDDLSGLLQGIFSPVNIEMVASIVDLEDAQTVRLIGSFVSQVPARSVAFASGVTAEGSFVQVAASLPDSVRLKLNRVADGSASGEELITLLFGDGAAILADGFATEVQSGAAGQYYVVNEAAFIAAKDDLLLIASSSAELEASMVALEKKENRLPLKRRFDSPNYWRVHADMPTLVTLVEEVGKPVDFTKMFKAPFEFEAAFSSKPGSFTVSTGVNILQSLADAARLADIKPATGANMFLAGGGKLLLALAGPTAFKAADLKMYPELLPWWDLLIGLLKKVKVSEYDVENMLNGSFSVVVGSDATLWGKTVPGGYLALTGRKDTAAVILGRLMASEAFTQAIPMAPLNLEGWDSLFALDPALLPMSFLVGVKKDTLFIGIVDFAALPKAPELPAEAAEMLDAPLFAAGLIDTGAVWNWLRFEIADSSTTMPLLYHAQGFLENILKADLFVPLIKIWSPELEVTYIEFSTVDVPEEKRLLPRLLELAGMF